MNLSNNLILLCALVIFSISNGNAQTSKMERDGEPDIYFLEGDDEEMNQAIRLARETLGEFYGKFDRDKNKKDLYFSIKMAFDTNDSGIEHIWLSNIQKKKGKLFGEVGNEPNDVSNLSLGQRVEIDENRISDWMIIENNKLIGGHTIRAIRNRMSELEKAEFDRQFGVIIE